MSNSCQELEIVNRRFAVLRFFYALLEEYGVLPLLSFGGIRSFAVLPLLSFGGIRCFAVLLLDGVLQFCFLLEEYGVLQFRFWRNTEVCSSFWRNTEFCSFALLEEYGVLQFCIWRNTEFCSFVTAPTVSNRVVVQFT